jgi:hypothetical protein
VFERKNIFTMMFCGGSSSEKGKAWINRSLENSATPAIWVTNDESIDIPKDAGIKRAMMLTGTSNPASSC